MMTVAEIIIEKGMLGFRVRIETNSGITEFAADDLKIIGKLITQQLENIYKEEK